MQRRSYGKEGDSMVKAEAARKEKEKIETTLFHREERNGTISLAPFTLFSAKSKEHEGKLRSTPPISILLINDYERSH